MKALFKFIFATFLGLSSIPSFGTECNVPMRIIVDKEFSNITAESASILENQLQRLATQSGLDIGWGNACFALTVKLNQIDRHIANGSPTQIVNILGATFYIADIYNQKLFASTYVEVKGVGINETKSTSNAIKRLNLQNASISKFLKDSKQQIIEYYNNQLPTILKEVKVKASMKNYEEALAMVSVVPSCCNGYDEAMEEAKKIYFLYRDVYFQAEVNQAKALWAANPTAANSDKVTKILAKVDPEAKCYNEAMELLSQIAATTKSDIDYETKKKYEDAIALEQLRIQAIGEIGKAYGTNQPKINIGFLGNQTAVPTQGIIPSTPANTTTSHTKMSGTDVFQKYGSAVFTIEVPSTDGTQYSQGSGFFINNQGLAVSNYHVLKDGQLENASITIPGSTAKYKINHIVKSDKENDYVVFSVNCSDNNFIPIATTKPNVGEKVYAIGSPKGFNNTFSSGEISQWRGENLIQTTVMIDHGSSGGALINEFGYVVGITSGTFDSKSVANLNYAISIDVIK